MAGPLSPAPISLYSGLQDEHVSSLAQVRRPGLRGDSARKGEIRGRSPAEWRGEDPAFPGRPSLLRCRLRRPAGRSRLPASGAYVLNRARVVRPSAVTGLRVAGGVYQTRIPWPSRRLLPHRGGAPAIQGTEEVPTAQGEGPPPHKRAASCTGLVLDSWLRSVWLQKGSAAGARWARLRGAWGQAWTGLGPSGVPHKGTTHHSGGGLPHGRSVPRVGLGGACSQRRLTLRAPLS